MFTDYCVYSIVLGSWTNHFADTENT